MINKINLYMYKKYISAIKIKNKTKKITVIRINTNEQYI